MIKTVELRKFGVTLGGLFLVFGGAIPYLRHGTIPTWPCAIATALLTMAAVWPRGLEPVHRFWLKLGHVLGFVNTRIILGVFYAVVIIPVGLLRRALGYDRMNRKYDPNLASYRVDRKDQPAREQMERIF